MEALGGAVGAADEDEVAGVTAAILEVCRRVVAAEEQRTIDPAPPPALPPLPAEHPLAELASRAALDPMSVTVLRLLVAGELDRFAHRCFRRLAEDPTQPGIEVDAIVSAVEGVGEDALEALDALAPDGALLGKGLVEWTTR